MIVHLLTFMFLQFELLDHQEYELIADCVLIGSEDDERMIRDMNKKAKEESSDKGVDITKKRKAGSRMKMMSKMQKTDVDLEEEEKLKTFLKIDPDEKGIIDYEGFAAVLAVLKQERLKVDRARNE
nr:hypothetical protein [Tanacetum cinerariifolium]